MDAAMSSAEVQKKNRLGQISWRKRSSEKVTSLLYFLNLLKMIVAKLDFIIYFLWLSSTCAIA